MKALEKEDNIKKAQRKLKEDIDRKKVQRREIGNKMLKEAQKDLIPLMKKKVEEIAIKIEETIGSENGLIAPQIELILGNRSLNDLASASIQRSYTPEELLIGLEMYRQVIAMINTKIIYPPSIYTFCSFMNMSSTTYKNYKLDPDRVEVMQMIDDYIAGIQLTSAQMGKLKEITTIFGLKSIHGFYEAQAPVQIKQEIKLDIDEIQKTVRELNKGKPIDVEFEEK